MTNSIYSKCKRCGKEYSSSTCPFCTVTGLDIEALLAEEGHSLRAPEEKNVAPVALVDTVSGKGYPVVAPVCKVGRDLSNDISLAGDRSLSRTHFQIRSWGDEYFVEDCGSRNGTFLNGSPISTPRKVHDGDIVSAGMSRYRFSLALIGQGGASAEQSDFENLMGAAQATAQKTPDGNGPDTAIVQNKADEAPAPQAAPAPQTSPAADAAATVKDSSYVPADADKTRLVEERRRLLDMMEKMKRELEILETRIATKDEAASATPPRSSLKGDELAAYVREVLSRLGWTVDFSSANHEELSVKKQGKVEAVVRIYSGPKEPGGPDVEGLINQQAVVWCQYSYEPKGIFVVQKGDYSADLPEVMARRKFCLVSVPQLETMERVLKAGNLDKDYVAQQLVNTAGALEGFKD